MPPSYPWRVLFAPCAASSRGFLRSPCTRRSRCPSWGPCWHCTAAWSRVYGGDQSFFAWSLGWWPDAVRELRDPRSRPHLRTRGSSGAGDRDPRAGVPAAPLDPLDEPDRPTTCRAIALPLRGLGAFLLCREVTAKTLPALVGGGVFRVSSYGLAESINHLNLAPWCASRSRRWSASAMPAAPSATAAGDRGGRPGGGADAGLHGGARHRRAVRARLPCAAAAVADGRRGDRGTRAGRAGGGAVPVRRVRTPEPAPGGGPARSATHGPREPWTPTRITAYGSARAAGDAARMSAA